MKGWLSVFTGPLLLTHTRYFFRLQWGFLSQYEDERSCAIQRYCVHAATISAHPESRKLIIALGPLGLLSAHGSDAPTVQSVSAVGVQRTPSGGHRTRATRWIKPEKLTRADSRDAASTASLTLRAPSTERFVHKIVAVCDSEQEFTMWLFVLTRARARNIARFYRIERVIGRGSTGTVHLARSTTNGEGCVAVKRIDYRDSDRAVVGRHLRKIQKEIQTQHKAASSSRNAVKVLDVFFDSRYVHVVMEYIGGGNLSSWLDRHRTMPELSAARVIGQLGHCIFTLHQHKIVHRDIKADNCLIEVNEAGNPIELKLTDFGFAEVCRATYAGCMDTFCSGFLGTATYMAPEIVSFQPYGSPVDIFALGVLSYALLLGKFPFDGPSLREIVRLITESRLDDLRFREDLSEQARSFLLATLNPDPKKRLVAAAVTQHAWVRREPVTIGSASQRAVTRSPRARLRSIVHVITSALAMQRWSLMPSRWRTQPSAKTLAERNAFFESLEKQYATRSSRFQNGLVNHQEESPG